MTKKLLAVLVLPVLFAAPALAAGDDPALTRPAAKPTPPATPSFFAKIDGIPGEATDPQHVGEIDVTSFAIGAKNTPSTEGGAAGKVAFGNVRFTKRYDAASPTLLLRTATGQHIPSVTFSLGATTYKLSDVQVVSFDQLAEETIELNFAKVQVSYQPAIGAPVTAGWDLKLNKSV